MTKNDFIKKLISSTTKGAISSIPIAGPFLSEYLNLAQEYITEKDKQSWMNYVEQTLAKLQSKENLSIETLAQNRTFYMCVQIATLGVLKAVEEEKKQLFANAIYNSVAINLSKDKKIAFMYLLDEYTLSHIIILKYLSISRYNPYEIKNIGSHHRMTIYKTELFTDSILEANPELKKDVLFVRYIVKKLMDDNLVIFRDLNTPMNLNMTRAKQTTKYGDEFLSFISENS